MYEVSSFNFRRMTRNKPIVKLVTNSHPIPLTTTIIPRGPLNNHFNATLAALDGLSYSTALYLS